MSSDSSSRMSDDGTSRPKGSWLPSQREYRKRATRPAYGEPPASTGLGTEGSADAQARHQPTERQAETDERRGSEHDPRRDRACLRLCFLEVTGRHVRDQEHDERAEAVDVVQ